MAWFGKKKSPKSMGPKELERAILWNDPELAIEWPIDGVPTLALKDASAPLLEQADLQG